MSELTELELARLAEARKWRPSDHVGRPWCSDKVHNFSADGREMGVRSSIIFRRALDASS